MSIFHSTVTRRDFMKGLGLTGATLGTAGMVSPVFHDLDEVLSSPTAGWKRPWYVKEREHDDPTVEVDWSQLKRLDHKATRRNGEQYNPAEQKAKAAAEGAAAKEAIGWNNGTIPGQQMRDYALNEASGFRWHRAKQWPATVAFKGQFNGSSPLFAGPKLTKTPEERGVPKWTGSPEEATHMLRAAMRFFGASAVYPGELNGTHRNLINATDRNKPIVFEDVEDGYETNEKFVLPANKELFEIGYSIAENREAHRSGPTYLRGAANGARYRMNTLTMALTSEFLRALGYICDAQTVYPITSGNGAACLHGGAEQARTSWFSIDPERDTITGRYELITDMHLAPTPPVDAGIFRFCHDCGHCADVCPSQSVSHEKEPSWETPLSPYTNNPNPGHRWKKIFWNNYATCNNWITASGTGCYICRASCVFMSSQAAMVHNLTRATLSTTPILNGFFASMFNVFDYGQKNEKGEMVGLTWENYARKAERGESWWDMSLPTFGTDSTLGTRDHGYNK